MGVGIAGTQYLWPNRTIPCEIDGPFPDPQRLKDAIAHWNAKSCIRFVSRQGENDYVRIVRKAGAASEVGRRVGEQIVSFGDSVSMGAIVHELGHTVGLWHEHCHSEQEQWVHIDFDNIQPRLKWQFELNKIGGVPTPTIDLGPYDYGSIMHYPEPSFPKEPARPVMTALQPPGAAFGQREGLSPGDIAAVEKLYENVPKWADDNRTAPTVRSAAPAPPAPAPPPPSPAPSRPAAPPAPAAPRSRWAPARIWPAVVGIGSRLFGRG